MFKRFFIILFIIASAIAFWFSFAIWTGLYSVYTFPPTKADPDGSTLIVSREEGEPAFNSPQHPVPPKKEVRTGGIGFGSVGHAKRPLDQRTIVELPYIDWAYQKSLEVSDSE